jgi:hypothetical protein
MQVPAAWALPARVGMILLWRLRAATRVGAAVDLGFMQLPTGSFCAFMLAGPSSALHASMRHAWAARRRPDRLASQRAALWGGCLSERPLTASIDRAGLPRGLSRRGRAAATLERSAACRLDFQGWPELLPAPLSPMAGWRQLHRDCSS